MQLPRVSTSALTDGYCAAIVAESLASVSAVDAADCCEVACCAAAGRAGNPAAMKSEMPIAAIKGRALPIALPSPFGLSLLLTRPRRAAQRLRRLAEGADEGAPHPLRIAKAGDLGDALDRLARGLHALL